jgi:imidazolonepropionase-like amidohydrolase
MIIEATALYTGDTRRENRFITVEGDRITGVSDKPAPADIKGIVTPCFIDPHSHIGLDRYGEPSKEGEDNDTSDQFLPANDPLNSIYFDDRAFEEAVDFGVLYSCVVPGSGNLLGGRAVVVRNWAADRRGAFVKHYGFKMALGWNPRSTQEWKGARPNTRMGIYGLLERKFDAVLAKYGKAKLAAEKKGAEIDAKAARGELDPAQASREREFLRREEAFEFDTEEKAFLEILVGKRTVKVHVHKEDDVHYLLGLVKAYGLNVTVDHAGDVHNAAVFDALAAAGIPVVYGPLGSFPYKFELVHDHYRNAKVLLESRAFFGLMTDHPVVLTSSLRDTLKFFLVQGMKEEEAIGLITWRNAKILGLDADLGTVEPGRLASLLVWDRDPLHLAARPVAVLAEGRRIR